MVHQLYRVWAQELQHGGAFGPYGAAIGAGLGLVAGLWSAYESAQDEKEKRRVLEQAAQQLNTSTQELQDAVNQWYKDNPSIGTQEDVSTYSDLVHNYDPNEFVYDYEDFDNNYDVNEYYAPNREALIEKTGDAVQARAAGARNWSWYWCC